MAKDVNQQILDQLLVLNITNLASAGVKQAEIRSLLGVDIHKVNKIAKAIKGKTPSKP